MSLIVAAGFTTFPAAENAAQKPLIAAGGGAYIGSLVGAMSRTRDTGKTGHHLPFHEEARASGVLVAVHVSPDNQLDAARVLREAGGATIEKATGRWQQGRWADFDPTRTPEPLNEYSQKHA
jgi:S-formylglutathione hydrolase FrmB